MFLTKLPIQTLSIFNADVTEGGAINEASTLTLTEQLLVVALAAYTISLILRTSIDNRVQRASLVRLGRAGSRQ